MALRKCEECHYLKERQSGMFNTVTTYWCQKFETERKPSQPACSWAIEQEKKGWPGTRR